MYRVRQQDLPFVGSSHQFVGADQGDDWPTRELPDLAAAMPAVEGEAVVASPVGGLSADDEGEVAVHEVTSQPLPPAQRDPLHHRGMWERGPAGEQRDRRPPGAAGGRS